MTPARRIFLLKVVIHLGALFPLVWLYYQAFHDGLGADPVKAVIHFSGKGALNILLLTLCISPVAKIFRLGYLINVRRLVGLYAFFYACVHLANFILFDLQNDFSLLLSEILKRPYIMVGMLALILLLALAVTSPMNVRRKMGRNWQRLHNSIYLIVLLVCTHYIWSVKSDIIEPIIYFGITFFLLFFRKDKLFRLVKNRF
ncbi:protein-methionine-sulfoxide reductase heme-binding subunit MsrQ [Neptunicella sp.]|uniref:protein-methionine-sulfoxide reductase heme-binding subunit MsrQ n=1 Tax=Neptunicella sp. TaxID=2125986 RepID=UPI003F69492E